MRTTSLITITAALVGACNRTPAPAGDAPLASLTNPRDSAFLRTAPDSFDVEVVTTKGRMVVRVHRDWSPHGVDRFHGLVANRFFDSAAFHRTIAKFVAQFGISGDPAVTRAWEGVSILDDPVQTSNKRGTLSFARPGAPNARGTQLFFNLVDNPMLDAMNGIGFPPIGEVVEGIEVLDKLNSEYSGTMGGTMLPGPDQQMLSQSGNAYLRRDFPRLDYINTARIKQSWKK